MNLTQLSAHRLSLAVNNLQKNSNVPQCLKLTIRNILQYLNEHTLNIQIIQSELSHKANSTQLNFGLSQKLSAVQFLQYFNKVQKVMEAMQQNQNIQQQKIQKFVEKQNQQIQKLCIEMETLKKQCEKNKKFKLLQIDSMQQQIKQMSKKFQIFQNNKEQRGKIGLQINKESQNQKFTQVLLHIREIQQSCSQVKMNVDQLMLNLKSKLDESRNIKNINRQIFIHQSKFVTFDELRVVLAQLQQNLSKSLNKYIQTVVNDTNYKNKQNFSITSNKNDKNYYNIKDQNGFMGQLFSHDLEVCQNIPICTQNPNYYQNNNKPSFFNNISLNLEWQTQNDDQQINSIKKFKSRVQFFQPLEFSTQTKPKICSTVYEIQKNIVKIIKPGFYQIICGMMPNIPTQLQVLANNQVLASHKFTQISKKGICRAIMLYFRVENLHSQIQIKCSLVKNEQSKLIKSNGKITKKEYNSNSLEFYNNYSKDQKICGFFTVNKLS